MPRVSVEMIAGRRDHARLALAHLHQHGRLQHGALGQPADVKAEIIHINTKARPKALQIALLVPLIAALLGLFNGFRMTRLPDPEPSAASEGTLLA
jgi:hypothetical protein